MNKTQIEASEIFLEVLTHIRVQLDIYREHASIDSAILMAFESGEVMLETNIAAGQFVLDENEDV